MVDLDLSTRQRRFITAAVAAVACSAAAVAYAGPSFHVWKEGETLTAGDLNANFGSLADLNVKLDARVAGLETMTYLTSTNDKLESGAMYADLVYQSVSLDLEPGTWRVDAFASLFTYVNPDAVQIALWDDTNSVEITGSRSPPVETNARGGPGCNGVYSECSLASVSTASVITVAAPTKIKIKVFRNGASQVGIGQVGPLLVLPASNRITALRLK
jgi:hypothetical protein